MLSQPSAAATSAAPGARALYLGGRERKQVSCTADALVVRNERAQTRRFPLARISRVVSSALTDWSGGALALCLQSGIGITWLDATGGALGTCYPKLRVRPDICVALDLMIESPEGLAQYANWLRARRMEVLVRWGKLHADRIEPRTWQETKREWVYGGAHVEHLDPALRGLCEAWVGAQLARHGFEPQLWGPQAQSISLDHDLCNLLWAEMNLCAGGIADAAHAEEPITALFERWNAVNGGALLLHLHSLYRTMLKFLDRPQT